MVVIAKRMDSAGSCSTLYIHVDGPNRSETAARRARQRKSDSVSSLLRLLPALCQDVQYRKDRNIELELSGQSSD